MNPNAKITKYQAIWHQIVPAIRVEVAIRLLTAFSFDPN